MEKHECIKIKWLGCAGFEMDFGGFTVVTDPFMDSRWLAENPEQVKIAGDDYGLRIDSVEHCDAIAVTHGHYDHITEVPFLEKKFGCPVLCGEMTAIPLMKFCNMSPMKMRLMSPNLELNFGPVKVKALFGVHTNIYEDYRSAETRLDTSPFVKVHPEWRELHEVGNVEYRNFLFTTPNGKKLLHWGNPLHPELCNIIREENPDILILQIGKATSIESILSLIQDTNIKHIVANHMDFPQPCKEKVENAKKLQRDLKKKRPDVSFYILQYGEWIEF